MYLFGIVGALVAVDIVFLIPVTVVPGARLRREYEEIEGDDVSTCSYSIASFWWYINLMMISLYNVLLHDRQMVYLK